MLLLKLIGSKCSYLPPPTNEKVFSEIKSFGVPFLPMKCLAAATKRLVVRFVISCSNCRWDKRLLAGIDDK